jgi:hypothetical protein
MRLMPRVRTTAAHAYDRGKCQAGSGRKVTLCEEKG